MKPITDKEWKRIVEQTSRADLPEPPFSRRYRDRRLELERMVEMKEERKFTFQPGLAVATVAALAIAAVPAGLILHMSRNQVTPPQTTVETGLAPAAAVSVPVTEETTEPIDNSFKAVEYGWLPEGMYLHEDGAYAGKIHPDAEHEDNTRGITPEFIRMPDGMDFQTFKEQVREVRRRNDMLDIDASVCFDAGDINLHYMQILHNGNGWDEVWFPFDGTPYVMHLYYQGVTEDEIQEVLKNLRLVPSDEETAGIWISQEDRGPQELEFSLISDTTLTEANELDTPWKGKIMQETEIAGLTFDTANLAQAQKKTQTYPALQIQYQKSGAFGDKMIDLMYTEAPIEDIEWGGDSEGFLEVRDYETFRLCVAAWNCTDEEVSEMLAAIDSAASSEPASYLRTQKSPEPIEDVPWFWQAYGVNNHGETYASAGQVHIERAVYDQLPDLIRFGGDTYKEGFVRKTELFEQLGDDPDDAMCHLMQDFNKTDTAVEAAALNVYDKEGENIIHVIRYYKEP